MQPSPRTEPIADDDRLSGRVVDGRYRLGPRVARGGMASVHEAIDLRLDRVVALKLMHPGLGDSDEFAARFVHEARAAARLTHPNVVAVYDQGTDGDLVYLTMEYLPGLTLRDIVAKEAPMPPERALALMDPVISALASAHRAGLIHRDVKPENVLLADDGRIKVADFGLAKAVSADTQHTVTGGVLIGTVSYLAPELVVSQRADPRADVYAVGVVLFELLTGQKPHTGDTAIQVAWKHVNEDVPPPSTLVPGIPGYVDALVARATARDPDLRPTDAGVLLHQCHIVAHALAEGVLEDPELVSDLAPVLTNPTTGEEVSPDTEPEPFDPHLLARFADPEPGLPGDTPGLERTPTGSAPFDPAPESLPLDPAPPGPGRTRRPRRRGGGLLAMLLAVAVVAGLGWTGWWYTEGRYTPVPSTYELGRAKAVAALHDAGLDVEFAEGEHSESVRAGKVLSSSPAAGSRVVDGGTVVLTLSLGKERYPVPDLAGLSLDDAQAMLSDRHLSFGRAIERFHDSVPAGEVLSSDPGKGERLRVNTAVDLVVSAGPRPIRLRDFTGRPLERARTWLTARDIVVEEAEPEFSTQVPEGHVLSQSPESGRLLPGETVTLTVSKGPELVQVPAGLVASGVKDAKAALREAGLVPEVVRDDQYLGLGYVLRIEPGSEQEIPLGSTVTLYLI